MFELKGFVSRCLLICWTHLGEVVVVVVVVEVVEGKIVVGLVSKDVVKVAAEVGGSNEVAARLDEW